MDLMIQGIIFEVRMHHIKKNNKVKMSWGWEEEEGRSWREVRRGLWRRNEKRGTGAQRENKGVE